MNNGNHTSAEVPAQITFSPRLEFRIVKEIPPEIIPQMREAVTDFMRASKLDEGVDRNGFFQATLESLASATYLATPGQELWIGTKGSTLFAYVLAHITREIDNRMTYWVYQAHVRKDQRGKKWVREAWQKIRDRAKKALCSHVVVVSSRGEDAYCRWLGKGWHPYASLLKEDI